MSRSIKRSSCHTICGNNIIYSFLKLQNTNYIGKSNFISLKNFLSFFIFSNAN